MVQGGLQRQFKVNLYLLVFIQTSCVLLRSLHTRKCWQFLSDRQVELGAVWSLFISRVLRFCLRSTHGYLTFSGSLLMNCDVSLCFVWQWTGGWLHRAGAPSSTTTICWHLLIRASGKMGSVGMKNCTIPSWDLIPSTVDKRNHHEWMELLQFWFHLFVEFVMHTGRFSHFVLHLFPWSHC